MDNSQKYPKQVMDNNSGCRTDRFSNMWLYPCPYHRQQDKVRRSKDLFGSLLINKANQRICLGVFGTHSSASSFLGFGLALATGLWPTAAHKAFSPSALAQSALGSAPAQSGPVSAVRAARVEASGLKLPSSDIRSEVNCSWSTFLGLPQ